MKRTIPSSIPISSKSCFLLFPKASAMAATSEKQNSTKPPPSPFPLRNFKFCQQHNTELVVSMVRQQFKKHMNETGPEKIQKLKDQCYLHSMTRRC